MNQYADIELLRKIVSVIISTNANITGLLLELESLQKREIMTQKIKQTQNAKQQKHQNGAETVRTANGNWMVEELCNQ